MALRFIWPTELVGFLFRTRWWQQTFSLCCWHFCWLVARFLCKTPNGVLSCAMTCVHRRSSITEWTARISQERFYLELPNFTLTSIPTYSTVTLDKASLATSGRKLSQKNCQKCRHRRLWVEFIQNGLSEDQKILHTYLEQSVAQTCRIWRQKLLSVNCKMHLNAPERCIKRQKNLVARRFAWHNQLVGFLLTLYVVHASPNS